MFTCDLCGKSLSNKQNFDMHMKRHTISKSGRNSKCQECELSFMKIHDLRVHLDRKHDIKYEQKFMEFPTKEEFLQWKEEEENKTDTQFINRTSTKEKSTYYYNCSRSGKYTESISDNKKGRQRASKVQGSRKLGNSCTSQMIIRITEKNIYNLTYFSTHYGHENDIKYLKLSKPVKDDIASSLAIGIPPNRIYDSYRDGIREEIPMKRENLLSKVDIKNIMKSYNLDKLIGVRHKDDALSIKLWASDISENIYIKMKNEEDARFAFSDFILIYMNELQQHLFKRFGGLIVAVDSTHGFRCGNEKGYELTTLMIIDEFQNGFPVAFMISNRKDTLVFEKFFDFIKTKIGAPMKSKVFMSDMAPGFYNAWCSIMGRAKYQLFCSWHVCRAWQKNLKLILDPIQRKEAYNTLRRLMYKENSNEFCKDLRTFIRKTHDKATSRAFAIYIEKNYVDNMKQWARCFSKDAYIRTNNHVESMHKVLKHSYFNGKVIKRIDKAIHLILKYIRNKTIDRIITQVKGGVNNQHTKKIYEQHSKAECLLITSNVEEIRINEEWKVIGDNSAYTVCKASEHVCRTIKCSKCNICLECFECECRVFFDQSTICKHIHLVAMRNSTIPLDAVANTSKEELPILLRSVECATISENNSTEQQIDQMIDDYSKKLKIVLDSFNKEKISIEKKKKILDFHMKTYNEYIKLQSEENINESESNKRNIEKQPRYLATKGKGKGKGKRSCTLTEHAYCKQ